MNDYGPELEALDRKLGHVHTLADCERVCVKSMSRPDTLTDDDITIIAGFHGPMAGAEARARRGKALAPAYALEQPAPIAQTKATTGPAPAANTKPASHSDSEPKTLEELFARMGTKPVSYKMLGATLEALSDVIFDVFKNHSEGLNALRQRNKELEARILELEAQRAVMP
jgi:hypothetical protein